MTKCEATANIGAAYFDFCSSFASPERCGEEKERVGGGAVERENKERVKITLRR
jgi:hypothetical protein